MAQILVLYESNNRGYTKAMAELVAQGAASLEGTQVRLLSVEEADTDDLVWAHGIAVGSPTNLGGISWAMKKWWDERSFDVWGKLDGKFGCAFSSSGAWGGGGEHTCQALNTMLMNFGMMVFGVTDYVAPKMSPHYGAICAGEPRSDAEKEMCIRLGQRLAEWCALYVDGNAKAHPDHAAYDRSILHG
ncbi:MAG: flavodoxin family protein [Pseudomonadota bacterium]